MLEGRKKNARSVREGEGDRERISQFVVIFFVVRSVTTIRNIKTMACANVASITPRSYWKLDVKRTAQRNRF